MRRYFVIIAPVLIRLAAAICARACANGYIFLCHFLRDTKDTLIVTNCGAEAIAFLKVYGVVPAATLFMLWYNWLSNHVSSRALFHMVSRGIQL